MRPERSQVLQQMLVDAQSTNATTSFLAIRRLKDIFLTYLDFDQRVMERAVHSAAFVLESGIMKPITQGLKEFAAGGPLTLNIKVLKHIEGSASARNVSLDLKPVVYLQAIVGLALDKRTVTFILKEFPALPSVLRTIFQMETLSRFRKNFPKRRPDLEIKDAIVRALPNILLPGQLGALQTAQDTSFVASVLQYAVEADSPQSPRDAIRRVVCLLQNLCNDLDGHALRSGLLQFATKVFTNPSEKVEVIWTIKILHKCLYDCARLAGGDSRPFPKNPALRCSVLALVLCGDLLEPLSRNILVALASILEHGSLDVDSFRDQAETEKSARKDRRVVEKAKQLRAILSAATPGDPTICVLPNKSRHQNAAIKEAMKTGLVARGRKTARRCSGPGCEKEEAKAGEFQVCSACKLAVYCEKGETSGIL